MPTKESILHSLITRVLDSIFVSLTVTVFVGLFLFYIEIPDEEKKFEIVESFKLKELFNNELNTTELWYFSGGMGRHTRSKTIPRLCKAARDSNRTKDLKIQVIDPTDEKLCSDYADYRKGLNSAMSNANSWNVSYVKREILATIISAIIHKSNHPLLEVSICLKNNFSSLRIDLSSKSGIITKEDPKEPALICKDGSFLYRTYKEEILQTFKQFRSVNTTTNFQFQISSIKTSEVEEILTSLDLNKNLNASDFDAIITILKENKNPYV